MKANFYQVVIDRTCDSEYFTDLDRAKTFLWEEFCRVYNIDSCDEFVEAARNQLKNTNQIDNVGGIYERMFYDA